MKALAFVVGLSIIATGLAGIVAPGVLVTIGQHSVTPAGLYVVGALRIVIGLVLLGASSATRIARTGVAGFWGISLMALKPFSLQRKTSR
jgi:hypothetical protein